MIHTVDIFEINSQALEFKLYSGGCLNGNTYNYTTKIRDKANMLHFKNKYYNIINKKNTKLFSFGF